MNTKHATNNEKGAFIVEDKSVLLGNTSYGSTGSDKMDIDKSNITEEFRGKGIENQLVNAVILHARRSETKVVPLTTFSKSVFANEHDVLID